jgi:hypothetical protein
MLFISMHEFNELTQFATYYVPRLTKDAHVMAFVWEQRYFTCRSILHSKNFWNSRIIICTLHGRHLQICFLLIHIWNAMLKFCENNMIQETPNFLFENQYLYPVETSKMAKKAVSFSCLSISINPRCVNGGGGV